MGKRLTTDTWIAMAVKVHGDMRYKKRFPECRHKIPLPFDFFYT
jgi:hypothetical protein